MVLQIIACIMIFLLGLICGRYLIFIIRATFSYYWFFKKKSLNVYFSTLLSILVTLGILFISICFFVVIIAFFAKKMDNQLTMFIFNLGIISGMRFFLFLPEMNN